MRRNEIAYFPTGAGLGAAVGLLLRDMRNALTIRTQDGVNRITQKVDNGRRYVQDSRIGKQAGEAIRNVVELGKNVASMGRQRLNDSIEAGKAKYDESIKSAREDWDASSF